MTTFPFDAFIRLVEFDQQMKQLGLQIEKEAAHMAQLHVQKDALAQDLEHLKTSVHDMQKAVDEKELDMKTLEERSKTLKHKIDTLTSTKDYNALRKELDTVHTQQNDLEESLVNAWHQLEVSQRVLQQKGEAIAQTTEKLDADIAGKDLEIKQLQEKLAEQRNERADRIPSIPAEWMEKYEGMHARVDNPAVPVIDGACSGCFYPVPNQDMTRLKRRALIQCNSCYRFLYDPAALQSDGVSGA